MRLKLTLIFVALVLSVILINFVSAETCAGINVPAGCVKLGNDLVCQFDGTQVDSTSIAKYWSGNQNLGATINSGCTYFTGCACGGFYNTLYRVKDPSFFLFNPSKVSFEIYKTGGEAFTQKVCLINASWSMSPLQTNYDLSINTTSCYTNPSGAVTNSWTSLDMTSIYSNWKDSGVNNGLKLDWGAGQGCSLNGGSTFANPDYSDITKRPKITLEEACQTVVSCTDADNDGYNTTESTQCGNSTNVDCNDNPSTGGSGIHPGATEICNGVDDDCDDIIDEGCPATSGAYWENMNGTRIFRADLKDTVKLAVYGSNLENKEINYTIEKETTSWWIFWKSWKKQTTISTKGIASMVMSESGRYRFNASSDGGLTWISTISNVDTNYRYLQVSSTEDNSPPVAKIISPKDKQMYFLRENINFSQDSYDVDDEFTYSWDLGDGTIKTGDSIDLANWNFSYAYSTADQKNILLTVTDSRGLSARDRVSILVINSSVQVLAYIDKPKWGEKVNGRSVEFNASSSYIINSTISLAGVYGIKCLGGMCPSQTEGCPPESNGIKPGCQVDVTSLNPGYEKLKFLWNFDDRESRSISGSAGATFNKSYVRATNHWATLTVELNSI